MGGGGEGLEFTRQQNPEGSNQEEASVDLQIRLGVGGKEEEEEEEMGLIERFYN